MGVFSASRGWMMTTAVVIIMNNSWMLLIIVLLFNQLAQREAQHMKSQ